MIINYWMRLSRIWRISSADQGGCYPQRPKAEVDNTLRDLQNSSYPTKAEFNNCFIIHSKYFLLLKGVSPLRSLFFHSPNITQPCPQVFSVNGSIIFGRLHFWRHWFNMAKISFQIWWTAAGYGELCVWLKPIRNGKIFWMNNNVYYCLWFLQGEYFGKRSYAPTISKVSAYIVVYISKYRNSVFVS